MILIWAITVTVILAVALVYMWIRVATQPMYVYGIEDMAACAGVSESKIETWIKEGMPAEKIHGTIWRTTDKDLENWRTLSKKDKREIRKVVREVCS